MPRTPTVTIDLPDNGKGCDPLPFTLDERFEPKSSPEDTSSLDDEKA